MTSAQSENRMHGLITNIQRFSVHDGPGIRTTIFFKGCNLRCFWCHNPEDMRPQPELQVFPERCIDCQACAEACPYGAHLWTEEQHVFQRDLCQVCGTCVDTCYAGGLVLVGQEMHVDEVMTEVVQDAAFYESSGGGVTLSGGEPLLQVEFAQAILRRCREAGIHTAIETAANAAWSRLETLLPDLDLVMMDIKLMDSERHQAATGVPNEKILANARQLGQVKPLIVRTPIVPGFNDTPEDIVAIAEFVSRLPTLEYYELLPFHPMGRSKYESLGMDYAAADLKMPPADQMQQLAMAAQAKGIFVRH